MPKVDRSSQWLLVAVVAALTVLGSAGVSRAVAAPARGIEAASPVASSGGAPGSAPVIVAPGFSPGTEVTSVGPLPEPESISVAVGLASPDPAGLSAYLAAEYGDGTPARSHFLSAPTLAQRFGATPASIAAAVQYFTSAGLSVTVSPDHRLLFVEGTPVDVGRAFGTTFDVYRTASGREFFSHPTPAVLPDIAPWSGALGLGNASPIVPASTPADAVQPVAGPAASCASTSAGLAPCQFWSAYDIDPLLVNGTNGSGVTLGIVDAYSSSESETQLTSDFDAFTDSFGLPSNRVNFLYPVPTTADLNASGVNPDWAVEDALDLEWARAAAPGATIDFTFSPNEGIGLYEAVDWLVAHQAVNVISLSWGEPDVGVYNAFNTPCASACNATTDGSYAILSPVLELAAAEGISVFAASGDCGAADGTSGVATNYPASDPYVTGVGGTQLNVTPEGAYLSEEGWSGNATGATAPGCLNQGGSGGGYAPFPRPWWQSGPGLPKSPSTRGVPDVAMDAETPATVVLHGDLTSVKGTSVGTPVWAGIASDLDQSTGQSLGFLDPALYRILSGPNYTVDFHEIESGSNGYAAGPGWNPVTGIGTPIVSALAHDISSTAFGGTAGLATRVTARPATGATPLTVTFSAGTSGGTGTYPIVGVYFGDGTAAFAAGGSVAHVYTQAGVYAAQSYVVDSSGNVSASPPALVVAGGGGILPVALSASNLTPAVASPVTLSVAVSGGKPPYLYSYFFGDGSFLNNSTSDSAVHTYGLPGGFCASVVVADSARPTDGGLGGEVGVAVGGAAAPDCRSAYAPLTVTGGPSVTRGTAPLTVTFTANVSGGTGGPYGYSWLFGDGGTGSSAAVTHTFVAGGTYLVRLNVSDAAGDRANATWNVTVNASASAPVPLIAGVVLPALAVGAALAGVAVVRSRRRPIPPGPVNP